MNYQALFVFLLSLFYHSPFSFIYLKNLIKHMQIKEGLTHNYHCLYLIKINFRFPINVRRLLTIKGRNSSFATEWTIFTSSGLYRFLY
jgi:hypothetical protein